MALDDAARRQRHFARRARAAREGRHLPTLDELLLGMDWFENSLDADAQAFAQAVRAKLPADHPDASVLAHLLENFRIAPTREELIEAAKLFRSLEGDMKRPDPVACAQRCEFYAACLGSGTAAGRIALVALDRLVSAWQAPDLVPPLADTAIGFLAASSVDDPNLWRSVMLSPFGPGGGRDRRAMIRDRGEEILTHIVATIRENAEATAAADGTTAKAASEDAAADPAGDIAAPGTGGGGTGAAHWTARHPVRRPDDATATSPAKAPVVIAEVGGRETGLGRRIEKEFEPILGKALPRIAVPDLPGLRAQLIDAFPYAASIIDPLLEDLIARPSVWLRPTLLVGPPGCGKTEFARMLLDGLGLPQSLYPCGGVSDSSLGGAARRWSTGEPSLPLALVLRHRLASPAILLDELEKVGTGRHNGNLMDVLLGLLEPASARAWHDPYIEAAADLSHLVWIATANSLDPVPPPLRDRVRILNFPEPGPEHLDVLASRLLTAAVTERGLDPRWALPLDGEERSVLNRHWRGGSIRRLRALVDRLVTIRERRGTVQ